MYVAMPLPDGSYFQLRFLPWLIVQELEAKYETSWSVIIDAPQLNGSILLELAEAVAVLNDTPKPVIETVDDLIAISNSVCLVDESGLPVQVGEEDEPLAWSAQT